MRSPIQALRSPYARVAAGVLVPVCVAASLVSEAWMGGFSGLDLGMFAFGLTLPVWMIWLSEPERLPASRAARLPASPLRRLALAPFLPGGGRAALLFTLSLAALTAASFAGNRLLAPEGWEGWVKSSMVACYLATWTLIPTAALSRALRHPLARVAGPPAILLWIYAFPSLLAWIAPDVPDYAGRIFRHYSHVRRDGFVPEAYRPAYAAMWATAGVALLVSVPRIVRGVREIVDPRPARDNAAPTGSRAGLARP